MSEPARPGPAPGRRPIARAKRALATALVHSPLSQLTEPLVGEKATVFLCHRFARSEAGGTVDGLRAVLEWLRRRHYDLVSVEDVVRAHRGERSPLRRAVAFTIDDGYADQADAAEDVFTAYDCPVTIFLTTGFLDGTVIPWWDLVGHVVSAAPGPVLHVDPGTVLELDGAFGRRWAQDRLEERCKLLHPAERDRFITELASEAGVALPAAPAVGAAPMTWDRARNLERGGLVRFGPHTVTHPILSRLDDAAAEAEVVGSWTRLREELSAPVPVFCYPNGEAADFGGREVELIRSAGMIGAVTVLVDHADPGRDDPFRVRRVPFSGTPLDDLQWVTGLERLRRPHRAAPGGTSGG